ncbi:MAG: SOS response-associated peptidase [Candidatus Sericytochromatia bacterium]|nr:SOS response-associated peptidase [Candidatus Sericytochromatia bacterium]
MSGRFALTASKAELEAWFGVTGTPEMPARYNIAPQQPLAVIRRLPDWPDRHMTFMLWGFLPAWTATPTEDRLMTNVRLETAAEKPSFRLAYRRRRCLVPATGFYEWVERQNSDTKTPYYFSPEAGGLIAMAALWEHWQGADGSELETVALMTRASTGPSAAIHPRMPLLLQPGQFGVWLDPWQDDPKIIQALIAATPRQAMDIQPISNRVNDPTKDDIGCIAPLGTV